MSILSDKRKNSFYLLLIIIIVSLLIFGFLNIFKEKGETVVISVNGEDNMSFPLNEDREVNIPGYDGGYNILVIKDGSAYIKEADCPDGLCISQGKIKSSGESIICLPHRVIIKILGNSDKGIDLISK